MAATPKFTSTPRCAIVAVSVANANRDGTGTIVDVMTGVTDGTRIFEVVVQATGTTTAGMIRLYLYNGTSTMLFDEITVAAATVSASVAGARTSRKYENLILPSASWKLQASTHNAEAHVVTAIGGDMT